MRTRLAEEDAEAGVEGEEGDLPEVPEPGRVGARSRRPLESPGTALPEEDTAARARTPSLLHRTGSTAAPLGAALAPAWCVPTGPAQGSISGVPAVTPWSPPSPARAPRPALLPESEGRQAAGTEGEDLRVQTGVGGDA